MFLTKIEKHGVKDRNEQKLCQVIISLLYFCCCLFYNLKDLLRTGLNVSIVRRF